MLVFSAAADINVLSRRYYQCCQPPLILMFSGAADISVSGCR
jgi:hypothetical protein